jgi:endonuclease YncB( thermonuclease family)
MPIVMLSFLAFANVLVGAPSVTDGDSLRLRDSRIRLEGIDAPEIDQTCQLDGETWECGDAAADALRQLIGSRYVRCKISGKDRYDRSLATCWVDDLEINRWMVKSGWALAYRRYSEAYVDYEDQAREAERGLWQSEFITPWSWRYARRR